MYLHFLIKIRNYNMRNKFKSSDIHSRMSRIGWVDFVNKWETNVAVAVAV